MSTSAAENVDATRPLLFQPFRIRDLTLKNRLVVPPMVHYRAGPGSTCGIFHNVHLGRYALGGFGMVFVEATGVEEIGLINEHDLGIWNDAQAQSFKPLIAFMRGENTAIGIQLAHGGRKSSSQRAMDGMGPLTPEQIKAGAKVWQPVGPTSEPVAEGWLTPRQLTTEECRAMSNAAELELISSGELARRLGRSVSGIKKLDREGRIPQALVIRGTGRRVWRLADLPAIERALQPQGGRRNEAVEAAVA